MKISIYVPLLALAISNSTVDAAVNPLKLDDLFPVDRVVEVDIKVSEDQWDRLRFQSRNFFQALQPSRQFEPPPSPYDYFEASVTIDGRNFPRVGIRKKGFIGSQDTNRPSLKVKLDLFDEDQTIGGLNNLTFNNNKQDVTLMNQFMGYAFFDAVGSPSSRCAYAKMTVNGKNLGIYCHVETVKAPLLEREFGSSEGTLYEGTVVDFYEGWEGSFERKTGDAGKGLEKIAALTQVMQGGKSQPLLDGAFPGRALVPVDSAHDEDWFKPGFDDSDWMEGRNGAGYEMDRGYEKLIHDSFDFQSQMHGKATSVYLRFPFELGSLEELEDQRLLLRMRCDDGFVGYLNGEEIARFNAPGLTTWNARATESRSDQENIQLTTFDISEHRDLLRAGDNLLAIHGMNQSLESSDLLVVAELAASDFDLEKELWDLVDEEAFYRFWAIEGLLSFWDGYSGNRNNFFFYLNPKTDKLHFLPWGTDCMFQKYSMLGVDRRSPRSVRTVGIIAHKLYQIPSVRQKYAATMRELLDKHWNEKVLQRETERIEAMLRPHLSTEQQRFVQYGAIRTFIRQRRQDVETEISGKDMPLWNTPPEPPPVIGGDSGRRFKDDDDKDWDDAEEKKKPGSKIAAFLDAAKSGDIDAVKKHLKAGQDIDFLDEGGGSALGMAALAGQTQMVAFLLDMEADPNLRSSDGGTPMHGAAFLGHVEVIEMLIEGGASVNPSNDRGETPLDACSAPWSEEIKGFVEFIVAMVEIDVLAENVRKNRSLAAALLGKKGAKPGAEIQGGTNLWSASRSGDLLAIQGALDEGADLHALDDKGLHSVAWSALGGQVEALELLVKNGADVNRTNRDQSRAIHGAAFLGRANIVEWMIAHDTDVTARDGRGQTALDIASSAWNDDAQGMVQFIAGILALELEPEDVREGRRQIVKLLRAP
ncbi:CotH kinase family protein [Verrucomicrobia bacterium]|nr:CotH kinase family protein [Verrucomicrobiota bacterium]